MRVLGARLALRRGALDEAVARADEILAGRRAAVRRAAGDADRRRSADRRRPAAGGRAAPRVGRRRARPAASRRPRGASTCGCAARCTRKQRQRRPTRTTTSRRARRCSICSASAIRRRSAISRSAGSSPRPARARSPSVISTRRSRVFEQLGAERDLADTRAARELLTNVGIGRVRHLAGRCRRCDRAADRGCGGAARSARTRDGGGAARSGGRRRAPSSSCELAGGDVRVVAPAGCDADTARALARVGAARPGLRPRHDRRRAARPRSRRARASRCSPRRGRSATRSCGGCG